MTPSTPIAAAATTVPAAVPAADQAVQGTAVEVGAARTATQRVWHNPDGSYTAEVYSGPNWTRDASGAWKDIDTNLVPQPTGDLAPVMAAVDVSLSGSRVRPVSASGNAVVTVAVPRASTGQLAASRASQDAAVPATDSAGTDPVSLTLGVSSALPTPSVNANIATYRDIEPGRDLRVKVMPSGVETYVDIKARPANIPTSGVPVSFPVTSKGLSVATDSDGGLRITDTATGRVVGETPPARIWDATLDPVSAESMHALTVPTSLRRTADGWVVTASVPADFFDTPGLKYPVTVDPAATLPPSRDTYVEKGYNNTTFGSEDDLKVGTYDGGTHVGRSYVQFTLSDAAGFYDTTNELTVVDSAKLKVWEWHAASCTPSDMHIRYLTEPFTSADSTWNTRPAQSGAVTTVSDAHRNDSSGSCAQNWFDSTSGTDVKAIAQAWADGDYPNYGFALTGSETSSTSWKRFYSSEYATSSRRPSLVLNYHKHVAPPIPSRTWFSLDAYDASKPRLSATVGGADSTAFQARFAIYNGSTRVFPTGSSTYVTGSQVGNGGTSIYNLPAGTLAPGGNYVLKAWTWDGKLQSASAGGSEVYDAATYIEETRILSNDSTVVPELPLTTTEAEFAAYGYTTSTSPDVDLAKSQEALQTQEETTPVTSSYGVVADAVPAEPMQDPDDAWEADPEEAEPADPTDPVPALPETYEPDVPIDDSMPSYDSFMNYPGLQLLTDASIKQPANSYQQWDQSQAGALANAWATGTQDLTASATSEVAQCHNNQSAAKSSAGWGKNHFVHCRINDLVALYLNCRLFVLCWEIGRATARMTTITYTRNGNRRISMLTHLDRVIYSGVASSKTLTLSSVCSGPCSTVSNSPITRTWSWWQQMPDRWAEYELPRSSGYAPTYVTRTEVQATAAIPGSATGVNSRWTFVRCDSAPEFAYVPAKANGCIHPNVRAFITYRLTDPLTGQEAAHVKFAQEYPAATNPHVAGKSIPGQMTGPYLHRKKWTSSQLAADRRRVRAVCLRPEIYTQPYTRGPLGQTGYYQCDEYPFASTLESALTTQNFSARRILASHNQMGGIKLKDWYLNDRIMSGDAFAVRVIR